jgi:hypothetical protein
MSQNIFRDITQEDQENVDELLIPLSMFNSIYDSGQVKNFAFADETKPPRNPLIVTVDDEGKDYPENARFTLNQMMTWGDLKTMLRFSAAKKYDSKASAGLFAPTIFTTRLWFDSPVKPARGFRGEKNATSSAALFIDADNKDPNVPPLLYDEAVARLRQEGVEAVFYTTASNVAGEHFRIVVPLRAVVNAITHRQAVEAVCRCLKTGWASDPTKNTCYSLFYFPGIYPGAVNQFTELHGSARTAQEWIDLYKPSGPVTVSEPKPPRDKSLELNREGEWYPEKYPSVSKYRSRGHDRHRGLFGMMTSVAMSTINDGYDLSDYELADFAGQEQDRNSPSSKYTQVELLQSARKALDNAQSRVTDPVFEKKAEAEAAEWERIRAEIEEMDGPADEPSPDDDDDEDDRSQREHQYQKETQKQHSRFRSRTQSRDLPPPVWLVDGLLQADSDNVIYAESQSLKTFIASDIGLSLVTGRDALGMFPIQTKAVVFYFAGEGRHSLDKERLTAWEIANGYEPYSLTDIWTADSATMSNNADLEQMIKDIEAVLGDRKGKQPVFFIIDTLSRGLNEGDEDKSNVAARYLNTVKKIRERVGGTSLTIAHTGKDKSRGIRGSSGFFGGFDTILFVENCVRNDVTKTHTLDVLVEKQRDGEDSQRYYFQSEKMATPTGSSLVLHPLTDEDGENIIKKTSLVTHESVISAIKELNPEGGTTTKRAIAKIIAEKLGLTVDGVEKALNRGTKFKAFNHDGKWSVPSYLNGADESLEDQIAELNRDRKSMFH